MATHAWARQAMSCYVVFCSTQRLPTWKRKLLEKPDGDVRSCCNPSLPDPPVSRFGAKRRFTKGKICRLPTWACEPSCLLEDGVIKWGGFLPGSLQDNPNKGATQQDSSRWNPKEIPLQFVLGEMRITNLRQDAFGVVFLMPDLLCEREAA